MSASAHRKMLYRTLVQLLRALKHGTEADKALHIEDGYETLKRVERDMKKRLIDDF